MQFLEKYNATPVNLAKPKPPQNKHLFSDIYELYIEELQNSPKILSKQSYDARRSAYNNLKPLHRMVFELLTVDDIESVTNQKSNLSLSSITNMKIVLKGMYKTAMRHGYVKDDLSALLIMGHSDENSNPHDIFTDKEIDVLWQHKEDFYAKIYLILIYTGMRINELLLMKSEDVHINERYMVGGLKTKAGKNRKIPIAKKILPLLDTSNEYLITVDGKKLSYGQARKYSEIYLKEIGLSHSFHDTRHTCTTLLERHKVSPLHIKLIVGHASSDITDHYTHVAIKDLIEDIDTL